MQPATEGLFSVSDEAIKEVLNTRTSKSTKDTTKAGIIVDSIKLQGG